jgi:hypothetical protein
MNHVDMAFLNVARCAVARFDLTSDGDGAVVIGQAASLPAGIMGDANRARELPAQIMAT